MTYIDLVNQFWKIHGDSRFSDAETVLYLKILDIFNRSKWVSEKVQISTSDLCDSLGWTRNKLKNARQRLKESEIIDFEEGRGSSSPHYILRNLCIKNYTQSDGTETSLCIKIDTQNDFRENLCSEIDTQIDTQNDLCSKIDTQNVTQIKEKSPTPPKEILEDNIPPSLSADAHAYTWRPPTKDEVLSMANQIMMPSEDAEDFFLYYEAQGWVLANGLPMKNWQSKLQQRNNENRAERAKGQMKGPAVKENSRRGVDNSSVETQTPETPEILAKQDIMRMISKSTNPDETRRYANKAYELKGTFSDAYELLMFAFKHNIPEAREMLGVV